MQENLRPFAFERQPANKNIPRRNIGNSSMKSFFLTGMIVLAVLIASVLIYRGISQSHQKKSENFENNERIETDFDEKEIELDISNIPDNKSLNEYLHEELKKILPPMELNNDLEMFLSPDISQKMMRLYHEESLNIFKTKINQFEKYNNILNEKYAKGKIFGEALKKEIELYEKCHPSINETKSEIIDLIDRYNHIFFTKNNYEKTLQALNDQIKAKESEKTKLRRENNLQKQALEKEISDKKRTESKLILEIEKVKAEIGTFNNFFQEYPNKYNNILKNIAEIKEIWNNNHDEIEELSRKKEEYELLAEEIEEQLKEFRSSKEVQDILRSNNEDRIKKFQKLAREILESILFEKNEVYSHKIATTEDKKSSIMTIDGLKDRYKYILLTIIKASHKFFLYMKKQRNNAEKAHQNKNIYSELKNIEQRIEALKAEDPKLLQRIKQKEDEAETLASKKQENEDKKKQLANLLKQKEEELDTIRNELINLDYNLKNLGIANDLEDELTKELNELIKSKNELEDSKETYGEDLENAYKNFFHSATDLNKKIDDCKVSQNFIEKMYGDFLSFCLELEKLISKKAALEAEIKKMFETLENQANLPG